MATRLTSLNEGPGEGEAYNPGSRRSQAADAGGAETHSSKATAAFVASFTTGLPDQA